MLTLVEKDIDSFFKVPFNIYLGSQFVSLFKDDIKRFLSLKNPLFLSNDQFTYWTAMRGELAVGRIVVLIHPASNLRHQLNWAYYGYFDCENNLETAALLMSAAESWAIEKKASELVGNINFTFMQQVGVVVEGFSHFPYSDQVYSPQYLPDILKKLGQEAFFPMITSDTEIEKIDMAQFAKEKIDIIEADANYKFKEIGYFGIKKFMKDGCRVLNEGFDQNPFFTPISIEEFKFQAKDLMLVIDPGLTIMVYHQSRPVGLVICIPDINPLLQKSKSTMGLSFIYNFIKFKFKKDRAVIIFYSVTPGFHGKGINQAILKRVVTNLKKKGYKRLGITWIADVNKASLRQLEILSAKPLHRLMLFKKKLVTQ